MQPCWSHWWPPHRRRGGIPAQLARSGRGRDQRSARRGGGAPRSPVLPPDGPHIGLSHLRNGRPQATGPADRWRDRFHRGRAQRPGGPPGPPRSLSSGSETTSRPRARRCLIMPARSAGCWAGRSRLQPPCLSLRSHPRAADRDPPATTRQLTGKKPRTTPAAAGQAALRTDRLVTSQHARHRPGCTGAHQGHPKQIIRALESRNLQAGRHENSRRSELMAADEWSRCVMACRIGWMAVACRAGLVGSGQITRDLRLGLWRSSAALGLARGLGCCEELVHDLGACGDDRPQFAAVDDLGCPGGGVSDEAGDFLDADPVVAHQADE